MCNIRQADDDVDDDTCRICRYTMVMRDGCSAPWSLCKSFHNVTPLLGFSNREVPRSTKDAIDSHTHYVQENIQSLQHRHAEFSEPFPNTPTKVALITIFSNAVITATDPNRKSLRIEGTTAKNLQTCMYWIHAVITSKRKFGHHTLAGIQLAGSLSHVRPYP